MERAAWTEERLDDLAESIRSGFARNDAEHREMRREIREGLGSVRAELREGLGSARAEMGEGLGSVRAEIDALRQTMIRVGGGMMIGFITTLGAIIVRGG